MSKFKVGDLVISMVTVNYLKKDAVYEVVRVGNGFCEVKDKRGRIIFATGSSIEHATKLHKFLVGVDDV